MEWLHFSFRHTERAPIDKSVSSFLSTPVMWFNILAGYFALTENTTYEQMQLAKFYIHLIQSLRKGLVFFPSAHLQK